MNTDLIIQDAEMEIIQIEEEIEAFEKEKMNLAQELDRIQREALIWQRKACELLMSLSIAVYSFF